jgi:hypothetical protein
LDSPGLTVERSFPPGGRGVVIPYSNILRRGNLPAEEPLFTAAALEFNLIKGFIPRGLGDHFVMQKVAVVVFRPGSRSIQFQTAQNFTALNPSFFMFARSRFQQSLFGKGGL